MRHSFSSKRRAWPLAAGAIMTAVSCTGSIGEPGPGGSTAGNNPGTGDHGSSGGPGAGSGSTGGSGTGVPGKPATGIIPSSPGPSSRFLRLNHLQWENTVRDLFRLPQITGLSQNFLAEPYLTTFNNAGGSYEVSSQLW